MKLTPEPQIVQRMSDCEGVTFITRRRFNDISFDILIVGKDLGVTVYDFDMFF